VPGRLSSVRDQQNHAIKKWAKAQYVSRPSGYFLVDDVEVAVTVKCVHCATHITMIKGSGRERGFCMNCHGVVCGKESCMRNCKPWQKKLEELEAGKNG